MKDKKFYRNSDDVQLGGVCSGIAEYLGVDTTIIRLIAVGLLVCTDLPIFMAYIVIWAVAPSYSKKQDFDNKKTDGEIIDVEVEVREEQKTESNNKES